MARTARTAKQKAALRKAQLASARKRKGKPNMSARRQVAKGRRRGRIAGRAGVAALGVLGAYGTYKVGKAAYPVYIGTASGIKQARGRSRRLGTNFSDEVMRTATRMQYVNVYTGAPYMKESTLNAVISGNKRSRRRKRK